jgi:flavin-binding protein dodecin
MAIDIEDVCTHAQLDEFLGGQLSAQAALLPRAWVGDSTPARQYALDRLVDALRRRNPPIREADLADVSELRHAVMNGAAAHIYRLGMATAGDAALFDVQARHYEREFQSELTGLAPTLTGGLAGGGISISVERR